MNEWNPDIPVDPYFPWRCRLQASEEGSDPKLLSKKYTTRKHTKDSNISEKPRGNSRSSSIANFFARGDEDNLAGWFDSEWKFEFLSGFLMKWVPWAHVTASGPPSIRGTCHARMQGVMRPILGDPGEASWGDRIFTSESLQQERESPWAFTLTERVPEAFEFRSLIGQKFQTLLELVR